MSQVSGACAYCSSIDAAIEPAKARRDLSDSLPAL
jgi:hypothetical protein